MAGRPVKTPPLDGLEYLVDWVVHLGHGWLQKSRIIPQAWPRRRLSIRFSRPAWFLVQARRHARLVGQVLLQAAAAQIASRTGTATIAGNAVVAGERLLAHGVEVAVVIRQCPGLGLVEPHQRGLEANGAIQPQRDGLIERLDELVTAIRVTGEIGLAHPVITASAPTW